MAWTAKLINKSKDAANPQNIRVVVEFTDGVETFQQTTHGVTITADYLRSFVRERIALLTERDTAIATLPDANTAIAPDAAPDNSAALLFQKRLRKLLTLISIQTSDATLVAAIATLKGQVETYIKNNPDAI